MSKTLVAGCLRLRLPADVWAAYQSHYEHVFAQCMEVVYKDCHIIGSLVQFCNSRQTSEDKAREGLNNRSILQGSRKRKMLKIT